MKPFSSKSDQSFEDRRRFARINLGLRAEIHDVDKGVEAGIFEVHVVNVSKGGLKMHFKGLLEEGARVMVNLPVSGTESLCLARIVWKKFESQQMCYGLEILRWSQLGKNLKTLLEKRPKKSSLKNLFPFSDWLPA